MQHGIALSLSHQNIDIPLHTYYQCSWKLSSLFLIATTTAQICCSEKLSWSSRIRCKTGFTSAYCLCKSQFSINSTMEKENNSRQRLLQGATSLLSCTRNFKNLRKDNIYLPAGTFIKTELALKMRIFVTNAYGRDIAHVLLWVFTHLNRKCSEWFVLSPRLQHRSHLGFEVRDNRISRLKLTMEQFSIQPVQSLVFSNKLGKLARDTRGSRYPG